LWWVQGGAENGEEETAGEAHRDEPMDKTESPHAAQGLTRYGQPETTRTLSILWSHGQHWKHCGFSVLHAENAVQVAQPQKPKAELYVGWIQ